MQLESRTLDDYIEAFERDRQKDENVDLRTYLPPADDSLYRPVLRELVRIDLEFGWESNRPRTLDDYRRQFPELFTDPDSLQEIAFEEYRLRRQAGQSPNAEEYASRYGVRTDGWPGAGPPPEADPFCASVQIEEAARSFHSFRVRPAQDSSINLDLWKPPSGVSDEVAALFRELHINDEVLADNFTDGMMHMPRPGGSFLGFHLLTELGRGAFGRVFLARQAGLADRPVALKVAPDVGFESEALARLQHTHIVPIYSVHKGPGSVHAVCMPYCGAVTVADLIRDVRSQGAPARGLDLYRVLPQRPRPDGVPPSSGLSPSIRAALAPLSYPEAVLWLGARLSEGLEHAHSRGIVHRDVKPANVLITDEGVPMLLDFNVAEDVKQRGASAAMMGGTLPYMAPEQMALFCRSQESGVRSQENSADSSLTPDPCPLTPVTAVDGKSDLYSLGIVLFELMTGRFPFTPIRLVNNTATAVDYALGLMLAERLDPPPDPRTLNPNISPAAAAIVRHCLEADPTRRYQSAQALREDIERHLRAETLRHAKEPSLRERGRKWLRRHPRFWLKGSIAAGVLLAVLAAGLGWVLRTRALQKQAVETFVQFQFDARHGRHLLTTGKSAAEREEGVKACRRALAYYGVLDEPSDWEKRPILSVLTEPRLRAARADVEELLLLLGRHAPGEDEADKIHRALREEEQDLFREPYLKARLLVEEKKFEQARAILAPLVDDSPGHYGAQFLLGVCYTERGDDSRAINCFTACIARDPTFYGPRVDRGLAYLRQKDYDAAIADFNRVLRLKPDRAETYLDRAIAYLRKKEYKKSIADLTAALEKGIGMTRVYLLRSRVRRLAGDKAGAQADLKEGLEREPTDELSWIARGNQRMESHPEKALADFDEALKVNPRSREALMSKAHVLADVQNRQEDARKALAALLAQYPQYAPALAGQAVVLARLGRRKEAHEHIAAALKREVEGENRYMAGCVYALTSRQSPGDADVAVKYLTDAIDARYGKDLLAIDRDLDTIRQHKGFKALLESIGPRKQQAQK